MPDRYWVGGSGTWNNSSTTNWSATSGGPSGASAPTASDDIFFDQAANYIVTIGSGASCRAFNNSAGSVIFGGTGTPSVSGSFTLANTATWSNTQQIVFSNTTTANTITTNGVTITGGFNISNSSTGSYSLGSAITTGVNGIFSVNGGIFNSNNFNITAASIESNISTTRRINLGSSTVTFTSNTPTNLGQFANLTFNAGTSTIVLTSLSAAFNVGGASNLGLTFHNVSFTAGASNTTLSVSGINTFNNLSITGPATVGVVQVTFDSRQTINGALITTNTAGNRRVLFRGLTYGLSQTLTINAAANLTDADFRDIYVVGTAAPISGTRIGDLRGNSGITFSAPKTVYWVTPTGGNWSNNSWASTSAGIANTDNFPLAQDTAIIENTGLNTSATITMNSAISYTGTLNSSTRTNAMTLTWSTERVVYGDWITGSGVNISNQGGLTFSGRNIQTVTTAGKVFANFAGFNIDSFGGTVRLADALNLGTNNLFVNNGTFSTQNFNVTAGAIFSANSNVRTINLGSSTVTLSTSNAVSFNTSTNLTFNAGTSQINCSSESATILTGSGVTFFNLSLTSSIIAAAPTINGANTFNNLTIVAPALTGILNVTIGANQIISGTLNCSGASPIRRIYLRSINSGTARILTVNNLVATDCDFSDITIAGAASGSSQTRAGDLGGNTGIGFPAPKTVFWNLSGTQNWSANAWASTSGGVPSVNNFPLAQDTAVFNNSGSSLTVSMDAAWAIGTFNASARTTAMTFSTQTLFIPVFGNWLWGTGVTSSTTSGTLTFFRRTGVQTITSNGVIFGCPITINTTRGTTQLADALTLTINNTLNIVTGTFDAVIYNVTAGFFGSGTSIVRMGTGTWTTLGTGIIWNFSSSTVLYKGTANIVLSSTSTLGRTFNGGDLSYNKVTIAGATGTSTLTISGNNQFTEFASTKPVAHTIALGFTTQTFGKWTVTGTLGNIVTLTGSGTNHILAGACTSGIDYLAMGAIGFAATSPGEFYAGANSTGTAVAPVYRTAKPADSIRYWVGGTGNWSNTLRWSTSSGGAGGASIPRSHDDVVFDSGSNATGYIAIVDVITGGIRCKQLTISGPLSGNLTLSGSTAIVGVHNNVTFPSTGFINSYSGPITLSGSTTGRTFTTNGVSLTSSITINGVDCGWNLGSNLITTNFLDVTNGSINLNTFNLNVNTFNSANNNSRTINFNTGTITVSGIFTFGTTEGNRTNLTFIAGSSQLNLSAISASFSGNNQTFNNVAFTNTSTGTADLTGSNTFNNLSFSGITSSGLRSISFAGNQTITGVLTISPGTNATMRMFLRADTLGVTRTLNCNAISATDVDFRDITIAGAAVPASGTRLGDCGGNSGITFTTGVNKFWNLNSGGNWSAIGWATTSGGTPSVNNFPLVQDTAIFESTGLNSGGTININIGYNIGTVNMSARTTNTMGLAFTSTPLLYGSWINGTGSFVTGSSGLFFFGRGNQTIRSAGRAFSQSIFINTLTGSITLEDSFSTSESFTLSSGTFNASTYNVTLSGAFSGVEVSGAVTRTLAIGSGTWTVGGTSWSSSTTTNLTVTGTGTINMISASSKSFNGGGISYANITLNQGGAGQLTITGNNTFANITNTRGLTGASSINLSSTIQTLTQFTASGSLGKILTISGTSVFTHATLILTGPSDTTASYLTINHIRMHTMGTGIWNLTNSNNGGTYGSIFTTVIVIVNNILSNFFLFF